MPFKLFGRGETADYGVQSQSRPVLSHKHAVFYAHDFVSPLGILPCDSLFDVIKLTIYHSLIGTVLTNLFDCGLFLPCSFASRMVEYTVTFFTTYVVPALKL